MQTTDNLPHVTLFTDGACINNPGPGGWGFILRHVESGRMKEGSGGAHATTNNRMEIMAVIGGLEALKRPSKVDLYSDSEYVVRAIADWIPAWKRFGWKKSPKSKSQIKNIDLWKRLDGSLSTHCVTANWVRGHNGHPENERCDVLAVAAAEQIRLTPPPPLTVVTTNSHSLFDSGSESVDNGSM